MKADLRFCAIVMEVLIEREEFLRFNLAAMTFSGLTRKQALRLLFNSYVLGDSVMEAHYVNAAQAIVMRRKSA